MHGPPYFSKAATALTMRSAPTSAGFFMAMRMPVRAPGPTTNASTPRCFPHISTHCWVRRGTTEAMPTSSTASRTIAPRSVKRLCSVPAISSLVRWRIVASRHSSTTSPPEMRPMCVCVLPTSTTSSISALHVEAEVDPRRAGGEGAYGNHVHAGLGQLAHALEAHAAGDLDERAAGDAGDGFADSGGVHIVQQHDAGAGGQGLVELVERVDLYLEGVHVGGAGAHQVDGGAHAAGRRHVIILD